LTADGNNFEYDNERSNSDNDKCGGLSLLFGWEQNLLSVTPAMTDFAIVRPLALL
jgi:hypothetical protein